MKLSPETMASLQHFKQAVRKAQMKLDSVPPELRVQLQIRYEEFKKQLNDSDFLKMLLKIEAITPRTKR